MGHPKSPIKSARRWIVHANVFHFMSGLTSFVTYEDRPEAFVGIKLLALSLDDTLGPVELILYTSLPADSLLAWGKAHLRHLRLRVKRYEEARLTGWSVKPDVLLRSLQGVSDHLCWLDSDLIVLKDFRHLLSTEDPRMLVLASQRGRHDHSRTAFWGFPPGAHLPCAINTCLVQVSQHHRQLLEKWRSLLHSEDYLEQQQRCHHFRSPLLYGDQDVLEAILNADMPDLLGNIRFRFISNDQEIFHEAGASVRNRLLVRYHHLYLIHAQGLKPWNLSNRNILRYVAIELSPYLHFARRMRHRLGEEDGSLDWLRMKSPLSWGCTLCGLNHPFLKSLPVMLLLKVAQRRSPRP